MQCVTAFLCLGIGSTLKIMQKLINRILYIFSKIIILKGCMCMYLSVKSS